MSAHHTHGLVTELLGYGFGTGYIAPAVPPNTKMQIFLSAQRFPLRTNAFGARHPGQEHLTVPGMLPPRRWSVLGEDGHRFGRCFGNLSPKLVFIQGFELYDSARSEESLEHVTQELAVVHTTAFDAGPGLGERPHKCTAAAQGLAPSEDLVECRLAKCVEESIALHLLRQDEEVRAPPQASPDVARDVRADDSVCRRAGVAPIGDVREKHEGEECPDRADGRFGCHQPGSLVEELGDFQVEARTVRTPTLLREASVFRRLDDSISEIVEFVLGDPTSTRRREHRGPMSERGTIVQLLEGRVRVLLVQFAGGSVEETRVEHTGHGAAKRFVASWMRLVNSAGSDSRSRRSASKVNAGKVIRSTAASRAPNDPVG